MESLSTLAGSIIVIVLVWLTALIVGQIAKFSVLKSLDKIADDENKTDTADASVEDTVNRRIKVKKGFAVYNIAISAITAVAILFFALFMNNLAAKDEAELDKIKPAPLPAKFEAPSKTTIEKSNEEAVTEKAEQVKNDAAEANTKAMNEAINTFRNAK